MLEDTELPILTQSIWLFKLITFKNQYYKENREKSRMPTIYNFTCPGYNPKLLCILINIKT